MMAEDRDAFPTSNSTVTALQSVLYCTEDGYQLVATVATE